MNQTVGRDQSTPQLDAETAELLQKKGTLEILVEIGHNGSQRHTDLREELLLSSSTIQNRLKSGKEQKLWKQELEDREGVAAKVYTLTKLGESLYTESNNLKLIKLYQSRRDIIKEIKNRERSLIVEAAPDDAQWPEEIEIEDYDSDNVQQILQNWLE